MSNLSDIGFPVKSDQDVNQIIMDLIPHLESIPCAPHGFYYKYEDESGAQMFLQADPSQDMIGFNPSFSGQSERTVRLIKAIERDTSNLDGAFHAWSNPEEDSENEESGDYPFVFDMPNFRGFDEIELPDLRKVQISAFASSDFQVFDDEGSFQDSQKGETQVASKSFIPSGLFTIGANGEAVNVDPPQAHAILTAEIKRIELKTNQRTKQKFYWFLAETFGGEIDIVADAKLVKCEPKVKGIVRGSFWLSGKIISV